MKTQIKTSIRKSIPSGLRLTLLGLVTLAMTFLVAADDLHQTDAGHENAVPTKLVEMVRDATRPFLNVNLATAAGYQPLFGCVSGPDHGAMGVHYISLPLVGDGEIKASQPEALIYEPSNEGLRLVGVEFIVDAALWMSRPDSP